MQKSYSQPVRAGFLCIFYFIALFWSVPTYSHSLQNDQEVQEKIYVTPEQIEVTEDGVLFYDVLNRYSSWVRHYHMMKKGFI